MALSAFTVLTIFKSRMVDAKKAEIHFRILVTALVEFQKNQCYFAVAIQIAAVVFTRQQMKSQYPDFFDAALLITIATNASIPIVFVLVCIAQDGRLSWHMIALSLVSFALSTATLVYSGAFWDINRRYTLYMNTTMSINDEYDFYRGDSDAAFWGSAAVSDPLYSCGNYLFSDLASWCGPISPYSNIISLGVVRSYWNWIVWAICLSWMVYCFFNMMSLTTSKRKFSWLQRITAHLPQCLSSRLIGYSAFGFSFSSAFGYQFYLFSLSFRRNQVQTTWSFGQIVAIITLLPCIVEYMYLEYCTGSLQRSQVCDADLADRWHRQRLRISIPISNHAHNKPSSITDELVAGVQSG